MVYLLDYNFLDNNYFGFKWDIFHGIWMLSMDMRFEENCSDWSWSDAFSSPRLITGMGITFSKF